jgi:Ca-activated chloride channel family protein
MAPRASKLFLFCLIILIPTISRSTEKYHTDIRVDRTVVLINVTVTDPRNHLITGLAKESFRLFEDKEEQQITYFASEDVPVSIGVVFDTSSSMGPKLAQAREAVGQFLRTANMEDEFFLIQFNDRPEVLQDLTTHLEDIEQSLFRTQPRGRTALLDAVYLALHKLERAHNSRKAILIISDGGDNSSIYTDGELRNLVRELDVQIFAIGIFEPMPTRKRTFEEMTGPVLLQQLTEQTGGRHLPVEDLSDLPVIAQKIGSQLRNQYILGYTPTNKTRDGKYRKVQVKLAQPLDTPHCRMSWRRGYYAPN